MSLRINQNTDAFNAYRNLSVTQGQMSKSLERLSSGYRINRAADDAAGLAISEGLRAQTGGLKVAVRNTQDGISVVQTAEGALTETHSILQRMRDLSVQSANDSNDADSRKAINAEATALKAELTRISDKTTFNNVKLLDGNFNGKDMQVGYAANDTIKVDIQADKVTAATAGSKSYGDGSIDATKLDFSGANKALSLKVKADGGSEQTIAVDKNYADVDALVTDLNTKTTGATWSVDGGKLKLASDTTGKDSSVQLTGITKGSDAAAYDLDFGSTADSAATKGTDAVTTKVGFSAANLGVDTMDLSTKDGATKAITAVDEAIKMVSSSRANLGALQNRFEHTINNLNVAVENLSASESRIRDTDMASEMMSFTRSQILSQAGTSMLAQANQAPQGVLSLLR